MTSLFSGHESGHASPARPLGTTGLDFYYDDPGGHGHTGGFAEALADADDLVDVHAAGAPDEEDLHAAAVEGVTEAVTGGRQDQGEQEEVDPYDLIVEAVARTIEPVTDEEILKIRGSYVLSAGAAGESGEISGSIRRHLAHQAHEAADTILEVTRDMWMSDRAENPDDVFSQTFRHVANDSLGEKPGGGLERPVDSTYFSPGSEIRDALQNGELDINDPAVQTKVEITAALLTTYGLYKANAWSGVHPDTLMEGLALMETGAALMPEFDPDRAGYDFIKNQLMHTAAGVQADYITKPNYAYARPEMAIVGSGIRDALHAVHRIEAVKLANNYDLEELIGSEPAQQIRRMLTEHEHRQVEEHVTAA